MKNSNVLFCLLLLLFHLNLTSQDTENDKSPDVRWSVFWNGSLNLEPDIFNKNKLTLNGVGVKLQKVYRSGLGFESKISFRSWKDFSTTVIPLTIGPSYTFSSNKSVSFLIRSGIGPQFIFGSDYASVFAGFDVGPEAHINFRNRHALVFGVAFAQAMSFHPDSFDYLDVYLGLRF